MKKLERSFNDIANQIIRKNAENLANIKADHAALNPDAIHDLRVATRRLRAAIETFKKMLPAKAEKIHAKLLKLGRLLGKKRNLDVFAEFILRALNSKLILFPKLARQMDKHQRKILAMLRSKSYESLIRSIEKLKTITIKNNVISVSTKRIRKGLSKVIEIAPSINSKVDDKTLHRLRISVKKLRYVCEFFESLFRLQAFIVKLIKIQEILGKHQDAIVGITLLNDYKGQFSLEEFRRIERKYMLNKKRARAFFFKIWNGFHKELERVKI